jgi:hypothetical protein
MRVVAATWFVVDTPELPVISAGHGLCTPERNRSCSA